MLESMWRKRVRQAGIAMAGLAAAVLGAWHPAGAQDAVIQPGYAAVTGYSGTLSYSAPEGADPDDYRAPDWTGPALRVIDLTSVEPFGSVTPASKTLTVTAEQVGQVFGVALDDAPQPNIYVAATSLYGVTIYRPDESGNYARARNGGAGAQYGPGQFGPAQLGGGSGSVWKIDGATGEVSLFANVDNGGSVASLGGLAYDPRSRQLMVVDRNEGLVHRFSLDGVQRGSYDHGTEGRPPVGLPAAPYSGAPAVTPESPAFETERPDTWGLPAPNRRIFAIAVHQNRLYYSVAEGPQVWSVGISASGPISSSPRLEVQSPALAFGTEITSISFDNQGRLYAAERGLQTGDYRLDQLAGEGTARVLRFSPKPPGDPTPGLWAATPQSYSIGFAPQHNNAAGGVAHGYSYDQNGFVDGGGCRQVVWATGERLLDPGDAEPGNFLTVDGLQGSLLSLVRPTNIPPVQSWFVDFDDEPGDADYRGHMGAIAYLSACAPPVAPPQPVPPAPAPPAVVCPPGSSYSNGQCVVDLACPAGTQFNPATQTCVYVGCPPGLVLQDGQCVPPPQTCPQGTFYYQGSCYPLSCPPGMIKQPNGACACPQGQIFQNGQCVPQACPPNTIKLFNGICIPENIIPVPPPPPQCPPHQKLENGVCVDLPIAPPPPPQCPPGKVVKNGVCVDPPIVNPPILCLPPRQIINGQCKCPGNQVFQNGQCKPPVFQPPVVNPPILCLPPRQIINGQCKCPGNQVFQNGQCKPLVVQPPVVKPPVVQPPVVKPPVLCLPPKVLQNGVCKNPPIVVPPPVVKPPVFKPPVVNPPVIKPPVIKPPSPQPPSPQPPVFKPPVIQLNPNAGTQIRPQLQVNPNALNPQPSPPRPAEPTNPPNQPVRPLFDALQGLQQLQRQ